MIEQSVSLASNGVVKVPGYEQLVRFGYTKNRGVYRLHVDATGEWEGLAIRCFWHVPDGKDPASSLVQNGTMDVPASVTAQPGSGCVTFEGSDGTKTVTSADLRYRVSANSGTEDGSMPEPGTPAWQELVGAVHTDATAAEQAKTDAQTAAQQAGASAQKAGQALSDTINAKEDALKAIGDKQTTATQAVDTARDKALQQVEASTEAAQTAASEAATSADKAADSEKAAGDAQAKAAESLQELKDGIASGNFKGEPGTSPTVTVQDITGGHRIVITDATGTSFVDVLNGKQGDPGKPGNTGATPELTIGTVEEGDAPSATITGTAKNPVLNLTLKSGAPGKDATVDATLSQSGKAADAKVTGDELARKAVIDDTTVGTDAWSSKHIVDTLCPPLEETGNPVVCYPVAGYPLGCKVSWEPTQEGSGDPSPDNVRPINGRDSVTVERCGENLLKLAEEMPESDCDKSNSDNTKRIIKPGTCVYGLTANNYLSASQVSNVIFFEGGVSFHSIAPGYGIGIGVHLVPGARYKIFYVAKIGGVHKISFYDLTGTHINLTDEKNFEVPANAAYACVVLRADSSQDVDLEFKNVAIVMDGGAESYAPYTGQTATLTLPHTIYGGEVDAVRGSGEKAWNEIALIDTYGWYASTNQYRTFYCVNIKNITRTTVEDSGYAKNWKCTHFKSEAYSYAKSGDMDNTVSFQSNRETLAVCFPGSIDELKSYLAAQYAAGTPVQIAYKLAEPVPFTATGAQPIPALSGVNTVITDADSVTVTGRADPIKRIIDLEDAVASMT